MKGFKFSYKPKDDLSRTLLNHTLFGRIVYKNRRGKKMAYYAPGLLDNLRFIRLKNSQIFVEENFLNLFEEEEFRDIFETFNIFGDILLIESEHDDEGLTTGQEYWKTIAEEKGCKFYVCKSKRRAYSKSD